MIVNSETFLFLNKFKCQILGGRRLGRGQTKEPPGSFPRTYFIISQKLKLKSQVIKILLKHLINNYLFMRYRNRSGVLDVTAGFFFQNIEN